MDKRNEEEESEEDNFKQLNAIRIGDIAINSTTESLDKVEKCIRGLIKDYTEFATFRAMDKVRKGIGGIG